MATTQNIQPEITAESIKEKSIAQIAQIARKDKPNWNGGIYFGAKPYLEAMDCLNSTTDSYGADSGRSIVAYFLANASNWRGETAKIVKAELNKRIKK